MTTETAVTEENDTNNVTSGHEEVGQEEVGSNETVKYLTQSTNNFMNSFVCFAEYQYLHINVLHTTFQTRKW